MKKHKIIARLQKGDSLVTGTEGAWISGDNGNDTRIGIKLFYEMVREGLIAQGGIKNHFEYFITEKGKQLNP